MKTKNQLLISSEAARAELQRATGMDDLTYHLMVLEAGCACLDQTLRPVNASVGADAVQAYREHLYAQGWWTWFEYFWRSFEVRLWAEWRGPESLVPRQSDAWRREQMHKEASTLYYTAYYHRAFEHFLKMLEANGGLRITLPAQTHPQLQQHA